MYVDVHAHLTHDRFKEDLGSVIKNAQESGLGAIVVNGLEPVSNRAALDLAQKYPLLHAALGIYPVNAVNAMAQELPFAVGSFDVDEEVDFIDNTATSGSILAIGECGLDGYWLDKRSWPEQERVFERLISIAQKHDLPLIVHSRKLEEKTIDILRNSNVKRVCFHCFGGKVKLAEKAATSYGWWFSIPANAAKNEAFRKMLYTLPKEKLLTETDSPYLSPESGQRNQPTNVILTVELLAKCRNWPIAEAKALIWRNYQDLFGYPTKIQLRDEMVK